MAAPIAHHAAGGIRKKAGLVRSALAGAIAAASFFILCWLGALLRIGPATHGYLQLFTHAEPASSLALAQGLCWSVIFGLVAGAIIALSYNALSFLDEG